jgi:hypothetical protein
MVDADRFCLLVIFLHCREHIISIIHVTKWENKLRKVLMYMMYCLECKLTRLTLNCYEYVGEVLNMPLNKVPDWSALEWISMLSPCLSDY